MPLTMPMLSDIQPAFVQEIIEGDNQVSQDLEEMEAEEERYMSYAASIRKRHEEVAESLKGVCFVPVVEILVNAKVTTARPAGKGGVAAGGPSTTPAKSAMKTPKTSTGASGTANVRSGMWK